ncbi:hypothetical protein GCM10020219_085980 [Nonomuraea dietziae]
MAKEKVVSEDTPTEVIIADNEGHGVRFALHPLIYIDHESIRHRRGKVDLIDRFEEQFDVRGTWLKLRPQNELAMRRHVAPDAESALWEAQRQG